MLRMLIVALLGVAIIAVAFADEPKPQWQRLLTGDDAKKAAELQKRIAELEAADKYSEAISLQEELIALRTKVQGVDHWETVNAKWRLTVLKKVATLPAEQRAGWREAEQRALEAHRLVQNAQYAKALPLAQEWLNWCRRVLGEEHQATATSYNTLASTLNAQGRYAEAGPLFQKALGIRRKVLGEEHPGTATSYSNLGSTLDSEGKHREAGPLLQKALEITSKVLGESHAETAMSYNNLAFNLSAQGKCGEAGPLLQKSLDIFRSLLGEEHAYTALGYNNLAMNIDSQGKHAEAEPLVQKALDISRKVQGERHPDTARSYNNVAYNLAHQGRHAEAEQLFRQALDIFRSLLGEEHPYTATSYQNVGYALNAQGKYADAQPLCQKALDISLKVLGEDHTNTAQRYNNSAYNLVAQGKYAEAEPLYQKALDIYRKVLGEAHPYTANGYKYLAYQLGAHGNYADALKHLESSARSYEAARQNVARGGLARADYGAERSPYSLLAAVRNHEGRFADAWTALEADLARGLLDEMASRRGSDLTPDEQRRREELRSRIDPINTRIIALASQSKRIDTEDKELDQLVEKRKELEKSHIELAVEASRREVATLAQVQAALPADAVFVAWVDAADESGWVDVADKSGGVQELWGCVVRPSGDPHWERLPGTGADGNWTKEDAELSLRFRDALAKSASVSEIEALAKKLHAQRLAPLSKHLAGVKRLFVVPVNYMAGFPIEALTDQYTVSYTPSGTFLARLKDRDRPRGTGVLAVGDPMFPPVKETPQPTVLPPGGLLITHVVPGSNAAKARLQGRDVLVAYAGVDLMSVDQLGKLIEAQAGANSVVVKVWREGQGKMAEREVAPGRLGIALAKEPAREAITARRQTDQMLAKLTRGEDFAELPGTQVEIARLAGLFDAKHVTTLTRAEASEQRLEEMRKADKLKQFKYLHFATHGKANNFRSFDSALILTRPEKVPEPRAGEPWLDGRLTAAEVLDYWKLDAELVTLSACESALGRQGGGDGLLGFAQAFLLAGSRSVCLTLWQVDDTATVLLMDRFYRNLLGKREDGAKPMGKAAALHEAKQWLRNLAAKDALQRLGTLTNGVVRGERPARQEMKDVPKPKDGDKDFKPYAHPRYWAAFILIGDPE
jgi:hypothetical protein